MIFFIKYLLNKLNYGGLRTDYAFIFPAAVFNITPGCERKSKKA